MILTGKLLGDGIKKVFVTGGAGFIGSHVVDLLVQQGYHVTCFDNLSHGHLDYLAPHVGKKNFVFVEGNLLDKEKVMDHLKGNDVVWHLAANTDIIGSHTKPERDLNDGVIATYHVLEAMRLHKVIYLLFPSSGAVYGNLCTEDYVTEKSGPLLPVSTYGAGKIGCESFISSYCHVYGIRAWIFRFGNVIGSRMTHGVIYDFINKLKKNPHQLEILGDGKQEKNYFLVEECIDGMAYAFRHVPLTENEPCKVFNLGTNSISRVVNIANIIIDEMGLKNTEVKIAGTKLAWPGDQPRVHMEVNLMSSFGWNAKYSSDESVRIAVRRYLRKES